MSEVEFVDGLIVKQPSDKVQDFVKCGLSIKRKELIAWLSSRDDEWVNIQIKSGKSGKWYAQVDNWKPKSEANEAKAAINGGGTGVDPFDDDLPFAPLKNTNCY